MACRASQSGLTGVRVLTPVFYKCKILPLKQCCSAIKYYNKHLYEKTSGRAIAQLAYDATPLIYIYIYFEHNDIYEERKKIII